MAALAEVIAHPAGRKPAGVRDPREIVAVVLADGTVRELREEARSDSMSRYTVGSISGSDWVLWWDRRSF